MWLKKINYFIKNTVNSFLTINCLFNLKIESNMNFVDLNLNHVEFTSRID